jgi:hypothetical protein
VKLLRWRGDRYPPGDPQCRKALPMALVLTDAAMWRHRKEWPW